jgi:hypothetical protein
MACRSCGIPSWQTAGAARVAAIRPGLRRTWRSRGVAHLDLRSTIHIRRIRQLGGRRRGRAVRVRCRLVVPCARDRDEAARSATVRHLLWHCRRDHRCARWSGAPHQRTSCVEDLRAGTCLQRSGVSFTNGASPPNRCRLKPRPHFLRSFASPSPRFERFKQQQPFFQPGTSSRNAIARHRSGRRRRTGSSQVSAASAEHQ